METIDRQNYVKLAYRYGRALSRWIKAGRPVRDEDEVLGIFTEHCHACEYLDENHGRCKICGCHVGTVTSPLLNKIAMGVERCPDENGYYPENREECTDDCAKRRRR